MNNLDFEDAYSELTPYSFEGKVYCNEHHPFRCARTRCHKIIMPGEPYAELQFGKFHGSCIVCETCGLKVTSKFVLQDGFRHVECLINDSKQEKEDAQNQKTNPDEKNVSKAEKKINDEGVSRIIKKTEKNPFTEIKSEEDPFVPVKKNDAIIKETPLSNSKKEVPGKPKVSDEAKGKVFSSKEETKKKSSEKKTDSSINKTEEAKKLALKPQNPGKIDKKDEGFVIRKKNPSNPEVKQTPQNDFQLKKKADLIKKK